MKLLFYPRDDNAGFFRPREIIERLQHSDLLIDVDWDHANAVIQRDLDRLIQNDAPAVIQEAHKRQFDNCPYVRVSLVDAPANQFSGMVWFDTAIVLKANFQNCDNATPLTSTIANLLGYDYEIQA